jgi:hypothetical protein
MGGFGQPSVSSKRQACGALDSFIAPYTEPSFPPLEIDEGEVDEGDHVSRQDALDQLTCYDVDASSSLLYDEPWSVPTNSLFDPSFPMGSGVFPYQGANNSATSFDSPRNLQSDHTLEFEIQSAMGMVWRDDEVSSANTSSQPSPDSSTMTGYLPDPVWFSNNINNTSNNWLAQTATMTEIPSGPAPVMIPELPLQQAQLKKTSRPTSLRSNAAADNLANYGDDLQAHAREQARMVQQELARSDAGA